MAEVPNWIIVDRNPPQSIFVDNGPEFVSKALDRWAYHNGVTLAPRPSGYAPWTHPLGGKGVKAQGVILAIRNPKLLFL